MLLKLYTVLIFMASGCLAAKATQGLDVRLISETKTITPGQPVTVGLHIHHHQGFHTYWKNPGVVGIPTSLKWQLPPGFTASEITWPYPELSSMAGHPCYGYERDVTLLVTITPPNVIQQKEIKLSAVASWMCCAKDCYPDNKNLNLTLMVSETAVQDQANSKLIQKSFHDIPQKSSNSKASLLSQPHDPVIKVRLSLGEKAAPEKLYLFSFDGQISSETPQRFVQQSDGSYLLTVARSKFSPKINTHLPAVLKAGHHYIRINPTYGSGKVK